MLQTADRADALMLDTLAHVAAGRAARERRPVAVDRNPAFWTLRPAASPPLDGWERIGVVGPGEDPVGVLKRLHTARQQGERVPASVPRVDPAVVAREAAPVAPALDDDPPFPHWREHEDEEEDDDGPGSPVPVFKVYDTRKRPHKTLGTVEAPSVAAARTAAEYQWRDIPSSKLDLVGIDDAARALLAGARAAAETAAAREATNEVYLCNRRNQAREPNFHPCPACLCPEYRIERVSVGVPRATEACLPKVRKPPLKSFDVFIRDGDSYTFIESIKARDLHEARVRAAEFYPGREFRGRDEVIRLIDSGEIVVRPTPRTTGERDRMYEEPAAVAGKQLTLF